MSSICLQYVRKVREVQPPVAVTVSGGTPERRRATVPPILKLCPEIVLRPAADHMLETKNRKPGLNKMDQSPLDP